MSLRVLNLLVLGHRSVARCFYLSGLILICSSPGWADSSGPRNIPGPQSYAPLRPSAAEENDRAKSWLASWQKIQQASLKGTPDCAELRSLIKSKDFPLLEFIQDQAVIECSENLPPNPNESRWQLELLQRRAPQTETQNDDIGALELQWRLARSSKDREEALIALIDLNKSLGQSEKVIAWQEKLWDMSPSLSPQAGTQPASQWLRLGKDYRDHLNYPKAAAYFEKTLLWNDKNTSSNEDQWELFKLLRQTYKLANNKKKMIQMSRRWSRWTEKTFLALPNQFWGEKYLETQLTHARGLWTEEIAGEASRILRRTQNLLEKANAKSNATSNAQAPKNREAQPFAVSTAEIDFIFARLFEQRHKWDLALAKYSSAQAQTSDPRLMEKILWAKSWLLYNQKKYVEAAISFDDLAHIIKDQPLFQNSQSLRLKSLFWQARSQEKVKAASGTEIYEALIEEDPLGYYGLMAQRELNRPLTPLQFKNSSTDIKYDLLLKAGVPLSILLGLDWSLFLRDKTLLQMHLDRLQQALGSLANLPAELSLEFHKVQASAGHYLPLFGKVTALTPIERRQILEGNPDLLFPIVLPDFVRKQEDKPNRFISSSLIYSIMRQESAFNPLARSSADALGLLQLLPSAAKPHAKAVGRPMTDAKMLYEPEFNIQVGARELDRLLKFWHGQYIPAIASYNAAAPVVRHWLKSRFRKDPLEFIEEIPYEETRNYVKLVLRNYTFYERFRRTEPFLFDENLLRLKALR